jgi:hypothetical protein
MDATTIVSVTGMATTLLGALGAAVIQGRMATKNASTKGMDEQRDTTYVDAIIYAQMIDERLNGLLENPLTRSHRSRPPQPDDLMIRARLFLVAPNAMTKAFGNLTVAWEVLTWRLNEDGPGQSQPTATNWTSGE